MRLEHWAHLQQKRLQANKLIAGYCWPQSALPEETIKMFCHTEAESFQFTVLRQGKNIEKIIEISGLEGKTQTILHISVEGCDWDPSFELVIDRVGIRFLSGSTRSSDGETADANERELRRSRGCLF